MTRERHIRLAKEGGWIIVGQVSAVLGALVLVRVLTEHLDPTQYGQLALGLTVAGLVNQLVMGGISGGIGRIYSIAAEKQDVHGYLHASGQLMIWATVVAVAIGLALIAGLLLLNYSQWIGLAAAALVLSVLSAYNSTLSGIQNAARQRGIVAFHGGLDAWLKILLAVGVMLWLGNTSTAVVMGYALSSLLITGSQLFFLHRLIRNQGESIENSSSWARQIWAYSWPFSTWGVFTWAQQVSDRWALEAFSTTYDVGHYSVLFQLGYTPVALASGLFMNFLGPILYQRAGDATDKSRNANIHRITLKLTVAFLTLTVLAFLAALLIHKPLFQFLVAEQYHKVSYLFPWMLLASGFMSCHHILGTRVSAALRTDALVRPQILMACLAVALNIVGAAAMGLVGLIAVIVIFSFLYFLWMLKFSNNMLPKDG